MLHLEELVFLATGICHMDFSVMCQEDFDTTFGSQNLCACDPFAMQIVSLLALTAPLCLERPKNKVLSRIRSFSLFFCRGHGGFFIAISSGSGLQGLQFVGALKPHCGGVKASPPTRGMRFVSHLCGMVAVWR